MTAKGEETVTGFNFESMPCVPGMGEHKVRPYGLLGAGAMRSFPIFRTY